ncbi:zinc metallopeptidase [Candidatus Formimonas warabiya]|uniref:Peptidase n=1 Tax=Formimonas warabiya TaxID=1761012 RepID=A0A3G1KRF4_FORW1|nr:zinc metallopeptidase [Candidatus Formimonas warabiya]ATW24695.1 peptidase [Candidatus Formimonas warabiya]
MFFWDPTFVLLIPGIIIAAWAQMKVSSTFDKYYRVRAVSGVTAAQAARRILNQKGLDDVTVEVIPGKLSDHYDPRAKALRLSEQVYHSSSLAAIGVAAHEAGHAMQHDEGYVPLSIRASLVPVAQFGSSAAWILLLLGLLLGFPGLAQIGVYAFAGVVLFQLVTLPVEYNASSRALALLEGGGYLSREEIPQTKKVLDAAALTYVAAALMGILQLIRLLVISGMLGRRDE